MQPIKWNAKWIWLDYLTPWGDSGNFKLEKLVGIRESEKNRWGLFRKQFTLPADFSPQTSKAVLFISIDGRYKCFLNEKFIGRGIYRCNRFNWYYDEFDITALVKPGINTLGVLGHYFGEDMSWYEPFPHGQWNRITMGKGGLIFEIRINSPTNHQIIGSDASVKGKLCDAWDQTASRINVGLPFNEIFDHHKFPDAWLGERFNDQNNQDWGHTIEIQIGDNLPNMVSCDIPRLTSKFLSAKQIITAGRMEFFFTEEDITDSHLPGETPIDFFMQIAQSTFIDENHAIIARWPDFHQSDLELTTTPVGIVFDMGICMSGMISFVIETSADDTVIDFAWAERLDETRQLKYPRVKAYREKYGMQYRCQKGINEYESFHWYGFRYIQIMISGSAAKISIKRFGAMSYLYPYQELGQFQCSDSMLSKVYDACRWTLRNCSHDGYEDCPSREQRQWVGDAYVEILSNFALFGDTALAKKLIRQVGQSQRGDGLTEMATPGDHHIHGLIIPDYCLYWISEIYQFYRYTGDKSLVIEEFPMILRAISWFLGYIDPQTHLLTNLPYWIFIDWSENDKWGANCVVNAQFYNVLQQIIELAEVAKWTDPVKQLDLDHIAQQVKTGINRYFWDDTKHAYVDAVIVDQHGTITKLSNKVTFHSNSSVLLYDIAPKDRISLIFQHVFDLPYAQLFVKNKDPIWTGKTLGDFTQEKGVVVAEPFFMHHVHQMFAKFQRYDQILRYLHDGWGKMIQLGATTIWESWSDGGSLCHAWCTTPAYDLATHCLGVQIVAPGAVKIKIAPHLFGLSWAEGIVPTFQGVISVRWEYDEKSNRFSLWFTVPDKVSVEIEAPPINNIKPARQGPIESIGNSKWNKKVEFYY